MQQQAVYHPTSRLLRRTLLLRHKAAVGLPVRSGMLQRGAHPRGQGPRGVNETAQVDDELGTARHVEEI